MSTGSVMVTGGSGFVGSHLIARLLDQGYEVHVFDVQPFEEAYNLLEFRGHPGLNYVQGDLRDADAVAAFYRSDASVIYHLASVVGVSRYMKQPLDLIDIAILGMRTLLRHALDHGTRFLFTSTSEIYGKNPAVPWSEDGDRVLGPPSVDRWSYSSSKAVCEHMLYALQRSHGLPFSTTRFFNVYGPKQNPEYVVSQSVFKALRNEQPFIYDDGKQTRCFCYIEDAIEGVLRASRMESALGEAINLGRPVESEIGEIVKLVVEKAGSTAGWKAFDTTKEYGKVYEDIPRRIPQVVKAKKLLDWEATTSLDEGLQRTIYWSRKPENAWWLRDR